MLGGDDGVSISAPVPRGWSGGWEPISLIRPADVIDRPQPDRRVLSPAPRSPRNHADLHVHLDPVVAAESAWGNRAAENWNMDHHWGYAFQKLRDPLHVDLLQAHFIFPPDWTLKVSPGDDAREPSLALHAGHAYSAVHGPLPAGWPRDADEWPANHLRPDLPPTSPARPGALPVSPVGPFPRWLTVKVWTLLLALGFGVLGLVELVRAAIN